MNDDWWLWPAFIGTGALAGWWLHVLYMATRRIYYRRKMENLRVEVVQEMRDSTRGPG